jgi:hypothetical protein
LTRCDASFLVILETPTEKGFLAVGVRFSSHDKEKLTIIEILPSYIDLR